MPPPTALIVDGNSYIHAHVLGTGGQDSAAQLIRLVQHFIDWQKTLPAVFFDTPGGNTWRHLLYPAWKADRPEKPDNVRAAIEQATELANAKGWLADPIPGHEADDAIAIAAHKALAAGFRVAILSRDKDFYQLLEDGRVTILKAAKKTLAGDWAFEWFTAANYREKYGLEPSQWAHFRALMGDTSDNWPGVEGIGKVTALSLIQDHLTLAELAHAIHTRPLDVKATKKQRENLAAFDWKLGLELMTLRTTPHLTTEATP